MVTDILAALTRGVFEALIVFVLVGRTALFFFKHLGGEHGKVALDWAHPPQ
ncbi:MAG: hypothetical protein ACYTEL_14795 [Planctomycetota bacterium]|jgi:hypothetical protein